MNEIVKYSNYMNQLRFAKFEAIDLNFLMALCSKARNEGTQELVFSFDDIRELINYKSTSNTRLAQDIVRMNKALLNVTSDFKEGDSYKGFNLFTDYEVNTKEKTLLISVNPKYSFILNELTGNFTRFELKEFIDLNSKYSKNLYRLLKQFRTTGVYEVNVNEFREIMDIPNSYTNRDVMSKAIKPSIDELQAYFTNLVCTVKTASRRGNPTIGYKFTFIPEDKIVDLDQNEKTVDKKKRTTSKFHNFNQRTYDFNKMEQEITGQITISDILKENKVIDTEYKEIKANDK